MIRTMGLTMDGQMIEDFSLESIAHQTFQWYWIDFDQPTEEEALLLQSFFHFHPLAIEDCLGRLQRPKLDHYDDYTFFVFHSLNQTDLVAEELNVFLGNHYIVTFHFSRLKELDKARDFIEQNSTKWERGPLYVLHQMLDKLVDQYFPILYTIEDHLDEVEEQLSPHNVHLSMDYVFEVRSDLLRLRRTIYPMRELLYRMLESKRLALRSQELAYFSDIYDQLLRLGEMIASNRELTADIRDSQLSINSNRMNSIMMTLTLISSIFIPLTFIVGVYGMNFSYMPELEWRYGYPIVLLLMFIIGLGMILWFKHKGWIGMNKS